MKKMYFDRKEITNLSVACKLPKSKQLHNISRQKDFKCLSLLFLKKIQKQELVVNVNDFKIVFKM